MKVLAAGKSTRPALASAPRCECSGNLGHLAIANGTPARRRHTDTWGVRATGPAAGGAGWRLGRAQAHGPGAARPARPPGGQQVGGQARGAAAFLHLLLLLFLLEPATLRCCSSRSAFSPIHPPSFFLSVFPLSLFQPRPGLLPGRGAGRPAACKLRLGQKQVLPPTASAWKAVFCTR